MELIVQTIDDLTQLDETRLSEWASLAGPSPMQSPEWLLTWWRLVGAAPTVRLCILLVFDDSKLVGVAPWYLAEDRLGCKRLRLLGDGIVCSDHASLAVRMGYHTAVCKAVADWLIATSGRAWHSIRWEAIGAQEPHVTAILDHLSGAAFDVRSRTASGCWTVDLSADWTAYLSGLSKSHRKRCRRWQRDYFDTGRTAIVLRTASDFEIGWRRLVELNTQRRQSIGDRSAFANEHFRNFHASILPQLLEAGRAELRELHLDGRCCAVEYVLVQDDVLFCYQSGMLSSDARDGYGNLSLLALFHSAIERGIKRIDFLRGDESYKSHWGAVTQACHHHFVASRTFQGFAQSSLVRTVDWMRTAKASLVGAFV